MYRFSYCPPFSLLEIGLFRVTLVKLCICMAVWHLVYVILRELYFSVEKQWQLRYCSSQSC